MRVKKIELDMDCILAAITTMDVDIAPYSVRSNLPVDARILAMYPATDFLNRLLLLVESQEWDDVPEGGSIPSFYLTTTAHWGANALTVRTSTTEETTNGKSA